jgi:hypothetical protein
MCSNSQSDTATFSNHCSAISLSSYICWNIKHLIALQYILEIFVDALRLFIACKEISCLRWRLAMVNKFNVSGDDSKALKASSGIKLFMSEVIQNAHLSYISSCKCGLQACSSWGLSKSLPGVCNQNLDTEIRKQMPMANAFCSGNSILWIQTSASSDIFQLASSGSLLIRSMRLTTLNAAMQKYPIVQV